MRLRHFLYLDDTLATEFLAQLEGGSYQEEDHQQRRGTSKEIGGGIGALGASAKAGKGATGEDAVTRKVTQTPESRFARLHDTLTDDDALRYLEDIDDGIWAGLRRGDVIEIEGDVAVSTLIGAAELASSIGPLAELASAFGESLDAEAQEAIAGLTMLNSLFEKVPVIVRPVGVEGDYKFVAQLDKESLRVPLSDLSREAVIVARVQRKLKEKERYTIFDSIPGLGGAPPTVRREMERGLRNTKDMPDAVIRHPAAIVVPVAIYQ